jgi:hypothetical protein
LHFGKTEMFFLQKGLDNRIAKQTGGRISAEVVAALINVRSTPMSERRLAKAPSPKSAMRHGHPNSADCFGRVTFPSLRQRILTLDW